MSVIDIVQASIDTWNDADRQGFLACYAEDCEIASPAVTGTGHDAAAAFWAATMGPLPDGRVTVRQLLADGGTVVEEATARGTNTGPSHAPDGTEIPATGRPVEFGFAAIHTVDDGKITSSRFYWDGTAVLGQLGLLPA